MRIQKLNLLPVVVAALAMTLFSCKTKKVATKPNPPAEAVQQETPVETAPVEEKKEEPAPAPEKPNFNFKNIQFEFNSVVLKTEAYQILEQAAREMKKDPSARFILNGHSSEEGSAQHNMSLSVDRANAVKSYLVNSGIDAANLAIKGFGETKPIATNSNEQGRALNRRVEIKVTQ
ncbi:OmpA family protein [Arcticibacter tournemirensis]|uniref:OmpA family protein n=1 Tax=Arcticibacter tournemirensis TaxID=699437 RepID=A0A4Q0MBI2_9SPHI|nr:OmpA family protein [Arcticibacter tournemirensis]RXF70661.1 OmpA family protein [Arcticibacter tournemirensis]